MILSNHRESLLNLISTLFEQTYSCKKKGK
uniref:Uncharacterized protein n=1 Tax=Rhizophora mucronata TaxID=61149 RepID=A0A2P2NIJ0_RHIMU